MVRATRWNGDPRSHRGNLLQSPLHLSDESASRISRENFNGVLDMAWSSGYQKECSSRCLGLEALSDCNEPGIDREMIEHIMMLVEWSDAGTTRVTWEFAETLLAFMEAKEYIGLLKHWAKTVEQRHDYLVSFVSEDDGL